MGSVILIDGNMLAHRCYHGMPDLSAEDGTPTGMEYGFLRSVEGLERKYTAQVIICWDAPDAKSKRRRIAEYYKANRESSPHRSALYGRLGVLRKHLLDHHWRHAEAQGLEADDLLYSLAHQYVDHHEGGTRVLIYTNDKDLLQTVDRNHIVVLKSHNQKTWIWDEEKVWEEFVVRPRQLPLLRSVLGDTSDNLPGCSAFGKEKTAEYVRAVYRTDEVRVEGRNVVDAFIDFVQRDKEWHSEKAWTKWTAFLEAGYLGTNYRLSCLELHEAPVTVHEPKPDPDERRAAMLQKWEIRSLAMCRTLLAGTTDEEEF